MSVISSENPFSICNPFYAVYAKLEPKYTGPVSPFYSTIEEAREAKVLLIERYPDAYVTTQISEVNPINNE